MLQLPRLAAFFLMLAGSTANAAIRLPPHNSNPTQYGPPAAQFQSACANANASSGAPLTDHVTWIWSTGGGNAQNCEYLTDQSLIGSTGSRGHGYAVGDVIMLAGVNGGTTAAAQAVVTSISPTVHAVTGFSFTRVPGSGGAFYRPYPTAFTQAKTTGSGSGFRLAGPDYAIPSPIAPVPNVNSGGYWPIYLDDGDLSHCDITCWQRTRPDWIMYDCDQKTPAFYQRVYISGVTATNGSNLITMAPQNAVQVAVGFGAMVRSNGAYIGQILSVDAPAGQIRLDHRFSGATGQYTMAFANMSSVPINWTNPAVQTYVLKWVTAYIRGGSGTPVGGSVPTVLPGGYGSINFDIANVYNGIGACGYYAGAKPGVGSLPSFGGTWTQLFSGILADPAFSTAAVKYACLLTAGVHALAIPSPFTVGNVSATPFSGGPQKIPPSQYLEPMINCFDAWISEATFFSCKRGPKNLHILTGKGFDRAVATTVFETATVSWADASYLCQSVGKPANALTPFQAAGEVWASAVFYLLQGSPGEAQSYMGMVGEAAPEPLDHARYVPYDPSWFPAIGTPTEHAHLNAGGCYERHYTSGLIELNTSTAACTFTVPTGAKDQFGNPVTSGTLPPLPADQSTIACSTPATKVGTCSAVVMATGG